MNHLFSVFDNFCCSIDEVRQSTLDSGFGSWRPNKGAIGSSVYTGMNFWGKHAPLLHALTAATGGVVFPNNMFFKVSNPGDERAYIHSDRHSGTKTCIVYCSKHEEVSGTAFWRHRRTGLYEMPLVEDMVKDGTFDELKRDMETGTEKEWEQIDFVRGVFNRALVFNAPLFHSRFPMTGLGTDETDGRMIWACHYRILGKQGELL